MEGKLGGRRTMTMGGGLCGSTTLGSELESVYASARVGLGVLVSARTSNANVSEGAELVWKVADGSGTNTGWVRGGKDDATRRVVFYIPFHLSLEATFQYLSRVCAGLGGCGCAFADASARVCFFCCARRPMSARVGAPRKPGPAGNGSG